MHRLILGLTALFLIAPTGVQARAFTLSETGLSYDQLSEAIAATGDKTATITIAPGTYNQCAVQEKGRITYRAAESGGVIFDGTTCEGKAALVLRGRAANVEGIVFQNMRVPDGNGAGIRLERGDLMVTESLFRDSEQGILTHNDPNSVIRINRSTFRHLGRCDRGLDCAHSIYIGHYGALIVHNSRFESGTGGHYVKSRANHVDISGNSFDDSAGKATNYMIDLPNGSAGLISDNVMVQGRNKENYSAFITIAPEGRKRDSTSLVIRDNHASFVPGLKRASTFVANWSDDTPSLSGNSLANGIRPIDSR